MWDEVSPQRVLVIDDDDAVRSIVAETLRGEGYQVGVANNGAAALEQLRAVASDVILLDIVCRLLLDKKNTSTSVKGATAPTFRLCWSRQRPR